MLTLNYRDTRPIYEQIYEGLRRLMLTGAIVQDEKLPSVGQASTTGLTSTSIMPPPTA